MGDATETTPPTTPPKTKVVTRPAAGGVDLLRPEEDVAALASLGEAPVSTTGLAARAAQAAQARRRESFDTFEDKVATFAEAVVDAASLGFLHITGDAADISRDVNSGTATIGQLTGFGLGMMGGPVEMVGALGKKGGAKAAKAVLGEVEAGSKAAIGVRTAEGAGALGAIMGATSVGHQVTDALLDDKPFAASAVIQEAGLGAVLGGGFSFLSGVFGRAARKYEIQGQGGLLDPTSDASKGLGEQVSSAHKAWDDALDVHDSRLGVLKQLEADDMLDNVVPEFMAERELAVAKAQGARSKLAEMSFDDALGGDAKAMNSYVKAMEDYELALGDVDRLMHRRNLEMVRPGELGRPTDVPGAMEPGKSPTQVFQERGGIDAEAYKLDEAMRSSPERLAQYEKLHGRPYEFMPERPAEPLAGGVETATSGLETKAGTPRRPDGFKPSSEWQPVPEGVVVPPGGEYRMDLGGATEARWPGMRPPVPEGPWQPSAAPGKFSMSEFSPNTLAGEGLGGREIVPTAMAKDLDNVLSNAHPGLAQDQVILPDGYFMPAANARQNAVAFENFRGKAQSPATVQPGVAEPVAGPTTKVLPKGKRAVPEATPSKPARSTEPLSEGKQAVRRYLDEWYATAEQLGPRQSPGDAAADHIRRVLKEVQISTAGRDISAGATDLTKKLGLEARTSLGATLHDIYAMRRLAEVGADASKGVVMSGRRGSRFLNWVARRSMGKVGASIIGGAIGQKIGGPVGYFAGAALAYRYVGFAGRAAGAAGRLYQKTLLAADGLLKGRRAVFAGRAAAGNRPVAYSDRGPIKDPVERIEELRRVASSPATMADFVARASGDLNHVSPTFVESAVQTVQAQLGFLLTMAPPIQYDRLGRPMQPSAGAMRKFLEAENAIFDLDSVLAAVQSGRVTQVQVEALRQGHTPVYTRIASYLMDDPVKLEKLERAKLRTVEMVLGAPLTNAADPMFVARQQASWQADTEAKMMQQQAQPAQALKIPGAGKPPSETPSSQPTTSQSYGMNGRAPGN